MEGNRGVEGGEGSRGGEGGDGSSGWRERRVAGDGGRGG